MRFDISKFSPGTPVQSMIMSTPLSSASNLVLGMISVTSLGLVTTNPKSENAHKKSYNPIAKCFQNLSRTKTFSNFPSVITKRDEIFTILFISCSVLPTLPIFFVKAWKHQWVGNTNFWKFTWVLRLLHFSIQNDVTNTSRDSQWSRRQEWEPWSEIRFFGRFSNDSNRAICTT